MEGDGGEVVEETVRGMVEEGIGRVLRAGWLETGMATA